jgi:hypothetical protein
MNAYNAKVGAVGGALGGLFGMFKFAPSDIRLKEDIKRVCSTDEGLPVYTYRYKGHPQMHMGVMAQEVAERDPSAVMQHESGFLLVDYSKVK